jgi:hypothetical protein
MDAELAGITMNLLFNGGLFIASVVTAILLTRQVVASTLNPILAQILHISLIWKIKQQSMMPNYSHCPERSRGGRLSSTAFPSRSFLRLHRF